MNKHTSILLLAAGLTGSGVSLAAADYTVTVDTSFVSQYMFRGVKLSGASLQPSVEVGFGDTAIGVWTSHSLSSWASTYTEVDIYATQNIKLSDSVTLPIGATLYWYPKGDQAYDSTLEFNAGLDFKFSGIKVSPKVYIDVIMEAVTGELTVGYSVPLEKLGSSLDLSAFCGYWSAGDINNGGVNGRSWYAGYGVELPYKLSEAAKVAVGATYHDGFNARIGGIKSEPDTGGKMVYSASVTVGF